MLRVLLLCIGAALAQEGCPPHRVEFNEAIGVIAGNNCKYLKLGGKELSSEQASALSAVLATNSKLIGLEMGNDHDPGSKFSLHTNTKFLGDEGMQALVPALSKHPTLKVLRIGNNHIGDAGAEALADILRSTAVLEDVFLFNNDLMGDKGIASIAKDGFHEIQIAHETSRDKETDLDLLFWIDPRDRRAQRWTNQQRNQAMRGFGERAGIRDL